MRPATQPKTRARNVRGARKRSCVWVLASVMVVACGTGAARLQGQGLKEEKDTEIIRGTVVNSVTHEPVGRALVYSPDNRFAMMSDAGGHFEFKIPRKKSEPAAGNETGDVAIFGRLQYAVRSGPNALRARKPGFLEDPRLTETILSNEAEQEVTIHLVPEGLIVGRVNLATEGVERIQVQLLMRQIAEGRENWIQFRSTQTRMNGEFRFANLPAGSYKLFTSEQIDQDPLTFNPQGRVYGYPPAYYPSANDFASAGIIHVTPGATVSANLTPVRRAYYPVKLGVSSAAQGLHVEVWPAGQAGPGYALGYDEAEGTIVGMLPDGNYTVRVNAFGEKMFSGESNLSVKGGPTEGGTVILAPNSAIAVKVKTEFTSEETTSQLNSCEENGKPLSKELCLLRMVGVNLSQMDEFSGQMVFPTRASDSSNEDSRLIENVSAGSYRLQVNSPLGYAASATWGGVDVLHNPLVAPPGGTSSPIEITLRDDGATVEGTIENWRTETQGGRTNSAGAQPPCVYLIPLSGGSGQPLITWASPDGNFTLLQVPPGTYRAIAFDRQPMELEFTDEEAMKKYAAKSRVIELSAVQKEKLSLALNSAGE
jgi:hypothetical protein